MEANEYISFWKLFCKKEELVEMEKKFVPDIPGNAGQLIAYNGGFPSINQQPTNIVLDKGKSILIEELIHVLEKKKEVLIELYLAPLPILNKELELMATIIETHNKKGSG